MADSTERYGLEKIGSGDTFSLNGYKFSGADRDRIDFLLARGAEEHHHDGATVSLAGPDSAPSVSLQTTGGALPAGVRVYYKFTWVVDGRESPASPEAYVDTPAAVATPGPVTLRTVTTGGTLLPGTYYYVVTAYAGTNTLETVSSDPAFVQLTGNAGTNTVTVTFPTKPAGATGFNVYRRQPGQSKYFYVTSSTGTSFSDTGAIAQDCDRSTPSRNATNTSNQVLVSLPGATPTVPTGYTWKIYRTYTPGDYSRALVHWVVEDTTEGGSIITPSYIDIGLPTITGTPPTNTLTITNPAKVNLTTETTGALTADRIADVPFTVALTLPGAVTVGQAATWVNQSDGDIIVDHVTLNLRPGSRPSSTSVIVDVDQGNADLAPTYTDLYSGSPGSRPTISIGNERSTMVTLPTVTLGLGGSLAFTVAQDGGGATPTAFDLTITLAGRFSPS